MKKSNCISVAVLSLIMLSSLAPVNAQIEVFPELHDFGEVYVGDIVSSNFTITNSWWGQLVIESTQLSPIIGGNFTLVNPPSPGTVVLPGSAIFFGVDFSPESEGSHSARITIQWTNGEHGTSTVELSGTGIASQPPSSIQYIIDFFDASVANGSLVGAGQGSSAENRLNALRNILNQASYLINAGDYEAACDQLSAALKRCDDFVEGTAAGDLKMMISELMNDLGC